MTKWISVRKGCKMSTRYLVFLMICLVLGGGSIGYLQGHICGQLSVVDTIAEKAEEYKQRFYDEGYEASKAEMTGMLVGTGPTRDYSNYSDPCMLAQGASYNTDPNIMWSLEVSDPNLIRSWKRKPEQR